MRDLGPLSKLADAWDADAVVLRRHGAEQAAVTAELHARQLREALRAEEFQAVTLEEAAEIGGYSYSHLQHLVAEGQIENLGQKHAPRIRRTDVPIKPGHGKHPAVGRSTLLDRTLSLHQEGATR